MIDSTAKIIGDVKVAEDSRIDAFCLLTGPILVGRCVHISSHCTILGSGVEVIIEDFAGVSVGVRIFTASDDYVGPYLNNPLQPSQYRNVTKGRVVIKRGAIVGANAVILPGVTIGEGASVGAFALVKEDVPPFTLVGGCPAKVLKIKNNKVIQTLLCRRQMELQ